MKYKVVNEKIINQVPNDYEVRILPEGFPSRMQESLIDVSDLGELFLKFETIALKFVEILGDYKYKYVDSSVVDNSPAIIANIKGIYNSALSEKIKTHLNTLNLNESKTKRKLHLNHKPTFEPHYSNSKNNKESDLKPT